LLVTFINGTFGTARRLWSAHS